MEKLPGIEDIRAAAKRIDGLAVHTPLIEHPVLNERVGGRVLLKAENLQRVGAFKFRGAYNAVSQIDRADESGDLAVCGEKGGQLFRCRGGGVGPGPGSGVDFGSK